MFDRIVSGLDKEWLKRGVLLVLTIALAVVLGRLSFKDEVAVNLFGDTAYWFVTAAVGIWVYVGCRMVKRWELDFAAYRHDWPWLGVVLIVTFIGVFVHQEPGLKIINDEPSQLATAKSLFEAHEARVVVRMHDFGEGMSRLQGFVDKRPILYAWLVAQTHAVTGYRESNGFWVSRVLAVFTTLALYALGRRMAGAPGGAILAVLMLLPSMQSHLANAGGFEMMNLLFIVLIGLGIFWYFDRPDADTESWLVMTFVLLSGLRYESVIFAAPVVLAVLIVWWRGRAPELAWPVLCSPLFIVPRLWLQSVFDRGDSWQLHSKPEAGGKPFSLSFYYENVGHALNFAFSTEARSTNSVILSALGLGCVGFWVLQFTKRLRSRQETSLAEWAPWVLWVGLCLHLGLMMVYFWGQFDDPLTQRLALPVHLWLALPVVGVWALIQSRRQYERWVVGVLAAAFFIFTAPQLYINQFYLLNNTARIQNKIRDWLAANPAEHRLVINNLALSTWLSTNTAVVTSNALRSMPERIRFQWDKDTFSEVLALVREGYDPRVNEWQMLPEDELGPDFDFEEVWSLWCNSLYRFRLLRVTAIRSEHLDWKPRELTPEESAELWKARDEYNKQWLSNLP